MVKNIVNTGYTKPRKPKSSVPKRQYDPNEGARVNPLKAGRGGAQSAAGIGGMFTLSPWAKQKTR